MKDANTRKISIPDYDTEKKTGLKGDATLNLINYTGADKDTILSIVKADEKIAAAIDGKAIVKEIVVPGKIINIVVK